jgi:hypothetical protein
MKVETKKEIVNGKIIVPKGTMGQVWFVTNSVKIQQSYGLTVSEGWFYMVQFPKEGAVLCDLKYLTIL